MSSNFLQLKCVAGPKKKEPVAVMALNGVTSARVKLWTTRITMAMYFLVGGIDYSVILPTMWDYIHGMGGQEWLYGLSRAAYSISDLIVAPLYGLAFDLTGKAKLIVLFSLLLEIGGKSTVGGKLRSCN